MKVKFLLNFCPGGNPLNPMVVAAGHCPRGGAYLAELEMEPKPSPARALMCGFRRVEVENFPMYLFNFQIDQATD